MQAAIFWKQMEEYTYCKAVSDSKLKDTIEKEMRDHSVKQRLKSMPFKIKIVSLNADWVALNGVFGEYIGSITQKELYKYIKENPTQRGQEENSFFCC